MNSTSSSVVVCLSVILVIATRIWIDVLGWNRWFVAILMGVSCTGVIAGIWHVLTTVFKWSIIRKKVGW